MALTVLVIDRAPPMSMSQGNDLIARQVFPRLRRDHHLLFLAPVSGPDAEARRSLEPLFDEVVLVPRRARPTALVGWIEPTLARRGIRVERPIDTAAAARTRDALGRLLAERHIDVVHVRQLPEAGYAPDLAGRPALLELVDSETLATTRTRRGRARLLRRFVARQIERRAVRSFPAVTVVAEADAAAIRHLRPAGSVEVIPNGVDAERFRPLPDVPVEPDEIVFSGAMSFPPNVDAVVWFAREVLPLVRARRPAARFTIVGRDPAPTVRELADLPAVTVTGTVDDVVPYLARAAAVVAPMQSGSGIKNKVLEALAVGRPLVATPLGVEGLQTAAGRDLEVGSGAAGLADAVLGVLGDRDRAAALGRNGRALVERVYTWEACADRYRALYARLAATSGAAGR